MVLYPFISVLEETFVLTASRFAPAVVLSTLLLPSSSIAADPTSASMAEYLPEDTAFVTLIDTRESTLQQLEQYAFVQQLQSQGIDITQQGALPFMPYNLDYQSSVLPWIGDGIAIALLPVETPLITNFSDHEVMLADVAQPSAVPDFIATLSELREQTPEKIQYQDFEVLHWEAQFLESEPALPLPEPLPPAEIPPSPLQKALPEEDVEVELPAEPIPDVPSLAIAVFPDFIVVTENLTAMQTWADLQPEGVTVSLAENEKFQRTVAHPQFDGALLVAYGRLSELVKYSLTDLNDWDLPFELPTVPPNLSPQDLTQFAAAQLDSSLEVLIYPTQEGMRLQGRAYYDDTLLALLPALTEPASQAVLNQVPGDSYAMINGQNLDKVWDEVVLTMEANEETAALLQEGRDIFTAFTGLDLDNDVFGWMDGGFSVFLFPAEDTPLATFLPEFQIGVGVALETSDRPQAEAMLAQLDETVGPLFATVRSQELDNTPVTSWQLDFDPLGVSELTAEPISFLSHSWPTQNTLMLTNGLTPMAEIVRLEPAFALPNSLRFLRSTADFPEANQGYLYANTAPMRSLFNNFFPPNPEDIESLELRKLVAAFQAINGTVSFSEEYLQLDGILLLAPADL